MKQFKFDIDRGDAQFVCEYPNYKALRSIEGFARQELEPFFVALRGCELANHYEHNGIYIAELREAK